MQHVDLVEGSALITTGEVVIRVVIAAVLGGLIGLERELSEQPAGLRTHILVSMGAALFTMVGAYAVVGEHIDPTRVAAQVVTGIGFIGAGVIFQQGVNIKGLTTAAALWVSAAIGTAVALGYWVAALTTTAITVVALYGLKRIQLKLFGREEGPGPDESEGRG